MEAVAHNPGFAKKVGIPQSVGQDFATADKGRKFGTGGSVSRDSKAAAFFSKKGYKSLATHERDEAAGKTKDTKAIAAQETKALKGAPPDLQAAEVKEHKEMGMKRGGKVKKHAPKMPFDPSMLQGAPPAGPPGMPPGMPPAGGSPMMKKGGSVNTTKADGIARKGKTATRTLTGTGMKAGGAVRGGGVESSGKTKGRWVR